MHLSGRVVATAAFLISAQAGVIGWLAADREFLQDQIHVQHTALQISMGIHLVDAGYIDAAKAQVALLSIELVNEKIIDHIHRVNPKAPAEQIAAAILRAADRNDLDPFLIMGLIETESHFDPHAVNPVSGARGLAQFVQTTAKEVGLPWAQAFFVEASVAYGARYLRKRIEWSGGRVEQGLCGYNGCQTIYGDAQYPGKVLRIRDSLSRA